MRILITGSREWTDRQTIGKALAHAVPDHLIGPDEFGGRVLWDQITVIHGTARGADTIAAGIAKAWGMEVEPHPANWETYGRRAGFVRNSEMVDSGADVCLAFLSGASRGTRHCMEQARRAGIPVVAYEDL